MDSIYNLYIFIIKSQFINIYMYNNVFNEKLLVIFYINIKLNKNFIL
jgi:hypothetical protein